MKRPPPESLATLKSSLENYYGNMHASMERVRSLYHQEFGYIFAKYDYDVPIHSSATATNIVDGLRNQVRTDEPAVEFEPISQSRDNLRHANQLKEWGSMALGRVRATPDIDPDLQAAFDFILSGAHAEKIIVDADLKPIPPATRNKKSAEWRKYQDHLSSYWPFVVRSLDPLTVYPAPGIRKPLRYVLETQQRRVVDMWEQYPDWPDPLGAGMVAKERTNPARSTSWLEYWSEDWYKVEADGARVLQQENPYGLVPYIFEFSGLGHREASGDPVSLCQGMLHPIIGELEAEVVIKTIISVQAQMHVFPTLLTTEDAKEMARKFAIGPGRILQYALGQPEPKWLTSPPPNENFYRYLDRIDANIARVANAALYGLREPGVDYGILQAQMVGQALKAIAPIRATMDRVGTQRLNMMARLMRVMELSMNVQGGAERTGMGMLGPEDFAHYNFSVKYKSIDPSENDRLIQIGEMMRRAGDLSRRTLWRVFAPHVVTDPDAEESELYAEKILSQMAESGTLTQIVLQGDAGAMAAESAGGIVQLAKEEIASQAGGEAQIPQKLPQRVESISGEPGLVTEPMNTARQAEAASLAG